MTNIEQARLQAITELDGVSGVSVIDSYGELTHSSIEDRELTEYLSFVSGMNESLQEQLGLGEITRITIKSPQQDNLVLFPGEEQILAVQIADKNLLFPITQELEHAMGVAVS